MRVLYSFQNNGKKTPVRAKLVGINRAVGEEELKNSFLTADAYSKFITFWDLLNAFKLNGYLTAAISTIGRTAVGTWWLLAKEPDYKEEAKDLQRRRLMNFYSPMERTWKNIQDFQGMPYKLIIASMYLRYFGQAAFHVLRNKAGQPIGLDFLHGFVMPNTDSYGNFKTPNFFHFPERSFLDVESYPANDIVFITNPDFSGNNAGGSDIESLAEFSMPTDLYVQMAARNYLENRDLPEAIWQLPADISDEAFTDFADLIDEKYRGAGNSGKSPIVVAGELSIEKIDDFPNEVPFSETRQQTKEEQLAVSGVAQGKLGIPVSGADLKETRREFHETTMRPLFRMIEDAFYYQIHVRLFGIRGWRFQFQTPDFLTAVEQATVHMRYIQNGVYSPNDVRQELGKEPRPDGDKYVDPAAKNKPIGEQGSPPEGREDRPDRPEETGEPTIDDQDPPRGDGHDDLVRSPKCRKEGESLKECVARKIPEILAENPDMSQAQAVAIAYSICKKPCKSAIVEQMLSEFYDFKEFYVKRFPNVKRDFVFKEIPQEAVDEINKRLAACNSLEEVKKELSQIGGELREIWQSYL